MYRIASLSATPRIRTNIFSKQLDWVELEEDGGREKREREWKEERVHCAQGKMVALYREGIAPTPPSPCVSSYLFLLAALQRLRVDKEREKERKEKEEEEDSRFVNIHYVCAEKGEGDTPRTKRGIVGMLGTREIRKKEFTVLYECVRREGGEKRIFFTRTNVPIRLN